LRKRQTPAEEALFERLSYEKTSFKFVRQHRIDGKFVDFCCRTHKVVIELDGDSHEHKQEQDELRDKSLAEKGYIVLRFRNGEVIDHMERVLEKIKHVCEGRPQFRY
jgi:very-short-patch-repair endonuclease